MWTTVDEATGNGGEIVCEMLQKRRYFRYDIPWRRCAGAAKGYVLACRRRLAVARGYRGGIAGKGIIDDDSGVDGNRHLHLCFVVRVFGGRGHHQFRCEADFYDCDDISNVEYRQLSEQFDYIPHHHIDVNFQIDHIVFDTFDHYFQDHYSREHDHHHYGYVRPDRIFGMA